MKQCLVFIFSVVAFAAFGQSNLNVSVKDSASQEVVIGATVFIQSLKIAASTGADGQATLKDVPDGTHELSISYPGYRTKTLQITTPLQTLSILLSPDKEMDEVVVSATRTNSRLDDSPLKVEVLGADDMDEENTIKPGNVASILGDVSGIQIQQSSAVSANSNVRIQGLGGKYTQMTRDGLPLYDGFSGGFGVMQIPPLDLKQVEIIKGSASTLFGGGAIGGVINFVSKAPKEESESIFTINQSTLKETNLNGYYAKRNGKIGISMFSGLTRQQAVDVNGDHFSDVPDVRNFTIHPRLFFYLNPRNTLVVGISSTNETRKGGDMTVLQQHADSTHRFFEQNVTERNTADLLFTSQMANKNTLSIKGSVSAFDRNLSTNLYKFDGRQVNGYSEISFLVPRAKNDLVAGVNLWADVYTNRQVDTAYLKGYEYYTIGGFVQNTFKYKEKLFVEAGLRADYHTRYGLFVLPRLSGLYKFNTHWYMRAGAGTGYKTPNPLVQQNTEVDLRKVMPSADNVTAERSIGLNAEVNYKARLGDEGSLQLNQAFFYTGIQNPVISQTDGLGITTLYNEQKPITSQGSDTYIRASHKAFELYLGYTYTYARNTFDNAQPFVTLTPLHRAAATLVYEIEGSWRFGLEGSYNGYQYLDDGSKSPDYFFVAAMIEKKFKQLSIVLNGENLLDARQTRYGSIVNAPYTNPSFKPLWGPIDGRIINLSVVFRL